MAIHRIIEQHAAVRGNAPALLDEHRALTYRDLNQRANAVARCLLAHGFRRGATALINMPRSFDLAVMCLGVLKAGGAYAWLDCDPSWPHGISIPQRDGAGDELKVLAIDVTGAIAAPAQSSANLPIMTRGTDIACILRDNEGAPVILVPHATITALLTAATPQPASWTGEPGALDLWLALITGKTAVVEVKRLDAAA